MRPIYLSLLVILVMSTVSFSATNISCEAITSPGAYVVTTTLEGAPVDASPIVGTSCIKIASSDVELNCNGNVIQNNQTPGTTIGIQINGSASNPLDNVTVKNCIIKNYTYGIHATYLNDSSFTNDWAIFNTNTGFNFENCSNISFSGCYGNHSGLYGFKAVGPGDYTMTNVNANNNNQDGFRFEGSSSVSVIELHTIDNLAAGFYSDADTITIQDSDSIGNSDGFVLSGVRIADIRDSISSGSTDDGIYITSSGASGSVDLLRVETWSNSNNGITIDNSDNVVIDASSSHGNTQRGISSYQSGLVVRDTLLYGNNKDVVAENAGTLDLIRVDFRSAAGNIDNPSTISLSDNVGNGERYRVSWFDPRIDPPRDYSYFGEQFDISDETGGSQIDSITFIWTDADSRGINEQGIKLYKHNGVTWAEVLGGNIDTNANTFTILDQSSFSTFSLVHAGSASYSAELYGANVTSATTSRWGGPGANGNHTTEGGNITGINVNGTALTERWAAFYGNVTGEVFLGTAPASHVYKWSWDSSQGGVMCLSTNSTLPNLVWGASGSDIDTVWTFGSVADNGNLTFNNSDCVLDYTQINGSTYADTGPAGGFTTCALKTQNTTLTSKGQMLFCGNITSGTAYNGQPADFELMVPTDEAVAATETYYFFVNLG